MDNSRNTLSPSSRQDRIAELVAAYRGILTRYQEIVSLSHEERDRLAEGDSIEKVNELLRRKKSVLTAIRVEEERVASAREWWKKVRRSLPRQDGQELLSLLDAISQCVEQSLALETECRSLLTRATAWALPRVAPTNGAPATTAGVQALNAYGQAAAGGSR